MLWLAPIVLLLAASSTCAETFGRKLHLAYSPEGPSPPSVDLKTAEDFTVLAYTTITNTGPTTVGGYIGVSPGSAVAGETEISYSALPTANGRSSADAAAIAKADAADAYAFAASRVDDVVIINVANIGGLTFYPGLYKTTGSLEVSSGTLYLNDPSEAGDGVFIFQMETTFSMSTGLEIILQNVKASNVFWQVGSSATFEVGSTGKGTYLAYEAISVKTGASIEGRLFALNAAVTLEGNTVAFPVASPEDTRRHLEEAYSSVAVSPPTVNLRSAEDYTVLAYATITNTGATTVGGLIGVSPGSEVAGETSISYAEDPALNGRASTKAAAAAKADVTTAYNDASGRVNNVVNINVANIGGLTFTPGLYKTTGSLEVSSGTLYLDAAGDADGIFIFQMETTLLVATGLEMILQNGAQASNVFWRVGSSAKFEVGSSVVGTVMAHTAIDVLTGATITGRLFSLNAAVNLQGNVVAFPPHLSSTRRQLEGDEDWTPYSLTATSPPTVDLLTAEDFTVLAYATVTNGGASNIGGLIGVSPGSAITGETGIVYDAQPELFGRASTESAATAKADVTTAYLDAGGRVDNVVNINVANIGGLTFTPGLYKTTGSLEVSSGTLYLRGNGTYIFQMETTMLVASGLKMVLLDDAQASNVFWRVGSSAKFEVGSHSVGTFMAHTAIDLLTGASIEGRLFSLNAAVNLQSNDVAFPFSDLSG